MTTDVSTTQAFYLSIQSKKKKNSHKKPDDINTSIQS